MENENVIGKVCFAILRKGFVAGLRISLELDSPGCIIGCKFDGAGIVGNTVIDDSDILLHITSHGIQTEKGHTTGDRSVFYIGVGAALKLSGRRKIENVSRAAGACAHFEPVGCLYITGCFQRKKRCCGDFRIMQRCGRLLCGGTFVVACPRIGRCACKQIGGDGNLYRCGGEIGNCTVAKVCIRTEATALGRVLSALLLGNNQTITQKFLDVLNRRNPFYQIRLLIQGECFRQILVRSVIQRIVQIQKLSVAGFVIGTQTTTSQIVGTHSDPCLIRIPDDENLMLKAFAWYLYLNKDKKIVLTINGTELDYRKYINTDASVEKEILISRIPFKIALIVWNEKITENFSVYFLDEEGVVRSKDTTTFNRNTVNFNHSVFVTSPFFLGRDGITLKGKRVELDGQTALNEYDEDKKVLKELSKEIQDVIEESLHKHMAAQVDKAIARMEARDSFPTFPNDFYGALRKKDLVQVTKEIYRIQPRIFHNLKPIQEKSLLGFLNLLLSSEERENVLSIIDEIVQLSPKQREEFASVLKRTHLENIIATIRFIEDRYKVIEVLKTIVFDYAGYANERDHVQKIVEQHYWLFGEQYHLVTADKRMQKALEEYLYLLYGDKAPNPVLTPDEEELRRMDIFACAARNTEDANGSAIQENLVVELKAPKVVLTKAVLRQIEDYMDYVRKQPLFNSQYRRWKFIAVCSAVDDDVKARYDSQKSKGKKGLVAEIDNYEVYALTWDDVFQSFDLRHAFLLDKLKMDEEAIAAEIAQTAGDEKSKDTADALTALVAN